MILTKGFLRMHSRGLYKTLIILALLATVLNADRLLLGEKASLRRVDVADQYITKLQHCGNFWKNPSDFAWDSSMLRGWPTYLGSVQPQHLGCFAASVLPAHQSFTVFQIVVESLVLIGIFLFLYNFLGYRYLTALYGCLFQLSMYYWFNENPFVTQTVFLPLIVAAASVGKRPIPRALRFFLLLLSLILSYPPYTVPLLPLCHLVVIFLFSDKKQLFSNIKGIIFFWMIYAVFYLPNLFGYLFNWTNSNRVLWEPSSFREPLMAFLSHMGFLFPCLPLVFMFYPVKDKRAIGGLILIFAIVILTAQAEYFTSMPLLRVFSFIYARIFYYLSFILVLLIAFLMEKFPVKFSIKNLIKVIVFTCIGAGLLSMKYSFKIGAGFTVLSLLSAGLVMFDLLKYARSSLVFIVLVVLFLFPFKAVNMKHYEQVPYGFLNQDPLVYNSHLQPYRVISVTEGCSPHNFYSAQASIKGEEILDGFTVFYNKSDAQNWRKYILGNSDPCSFKVWNNRIELTRAVWEENADQIVQWVRLNNTHFIRSEFELQHKSIVLDQKKVVPLHSWKSYFRLNSPIDKNYYLYRIKEPFSRIFAVDDKIIGQKKGQFLQEDSLFKSLDELPVQNISMQTYSPSELTWQGDFDNQVLLVSTNYHKSWNLFVDNKISKDAIQKGPFGMVMILPDDNFHEYVLRYNDHSYMYMLFCMVFGAGALLLFTRRMNEGLSNVL